ncbi:MAG TPA: phosphoglycerate mutase family protein [Gammaproteobacteria bacterium]|nr:phosphoglycerate mutase family protein [Gammaproteobacteria bacterium]
MKSVAIIRHGIPEDAGPGQRDADRALTDDGARAFEQAAKGLRTVLDPVHLIASSPLTRAVQTAEILARTYSGPAFIRTDALAPGRRPKELLNWLWQAPPNETIALVGHEPDLGHLLSFALGRVDWTFWHPGKGACALLSITDNAEPGAAQLEWCLTQGQLQALAPAP